MELIVFMTDLFSQFHRLKYKGVLHNSFLKQMQFKIKGGKIMVIVKTRGPCPFPYLCFFYSPCIWEERIILTIHVCARQ